MDPSTIADLTHLLVEPVPCYAGDAGFTMSITCCYPYSPPKPTSTPKSTENDPPHPPRVICAHTVSIGTHTGTHVDAPFHLFPSGQKLHEIPLAQFIGRAVILDVRHLARERGMITWEDMMNSPSMAAELSCIGSRTDGKADIVLLWTGWDAHWRKSTYFAHPYFSRDVAVALLDLGVKTVGVDSLNPDKTPAKMETETEHAMHEVLLGNGIIICENMKGLGELVNAGDEGEETWIGLMPLNIHGADGSPVRAYGWKQPLRRAH